MDFPVLITFTIDPAEWADEYDLADSDAALKDIKAILAAAIDEGRLAADIAAEWPMMRDAATITAEYVDKGDYDNRVKRA